MNIRAFLFAAALVFVGCASEDPNIVNPPAGTRRIAVRLFNMIPDGQNRRVLLEYGFQSSDVAPLSFSDSVRSPGDSSFIEIVRGGVTELRTESRVSFAPNAVYDIFTLAKLGRPTEFDTILLTNANAALTTLPVAQVRLVNLIPDTSRRFDIRVGCPNGSALISSSVSFGRASLYGEVYPGFAVFSILETRDGVQSVLGTYQCALKERTPYSVIVYRDAASETPLILFIEESDLTRNAERPFAVVNERSADIRSVNLTNSSMSVSVATGSGTIVDNLGSLQMSNAVPVTTCASDRPDVFVATFANGQTATDSVSLAVRGTFTVYGADSAGTARLVVTPTIQRPFGSAGKAVVRVVNTSAIAGSIVVSLGARSDASAQNGIASGFTIARNVNFDSYSEPIALAPGILPLTITTSRTPTNILDVTRAIVEENAEYDLVIYDLQGEVRTALVAQGRGAGSIQPLDEAVFVKIANASNRETSIPISVGAVIPTGALFYANSIATTLPVGMVPYTLGTVSGSLETRKGERTITMYSYGGGSPNVISITTPPLVPEAGLTKRRVINATEDIALISVCVDSMPKISGDGEHLAIDVQYGTASKVSVSDMDRRGTYFFYDATTLQQLYTLPIQFAPLGNNYSIIVVGRKATGYEVIVSQEY